jgi:phi13 family phage major tail protein
MGKKQRRGCSRLVYAPYTYDEETKAVTFGTVKTLAPVKSVSIEVSSESEEVWADNVLQDTVYGGTAINKTFSVTRVPADVEAELLGLTTITAGGKTFYGTRPDGEKRPYVAIGYALHDGEITKPCECYWAFKCIVNSISKAANTIDRGTGSEGQEVAITVSAPDVAWTKTNDKDLDIMLPVDETMTINDVETFFKQVVTYDNAETLFTA